MKKIFIIFGIILLIIFIILLINKNPDSVSKINYKKISFNQMEEMISREESLEYIILDVRTEEEYQDGHIFESKLLPDYMIEDIKSIEPNKQKTIFVYCRSGNRSKTATQKLNELGYQNVYDLGGIIDYKGSLEY